MIYRSYFNDMVLLPESIQLQGKFHMMDIVIYIVGACFIAFILSLCFALYAHLKVKAKQKQS